MSRWHCHKCGASWPDDGLSRGCSCPKDDRVLASGPSVYEENKDVPSHTVYCLDRKQWKESMGAPVHPQFDPERYVSAVDSLRCSVDSLLGSLDYHLGEIRSALEWVKKEAGE